MTDPSDLKVFYDGACPLCRREITVYKNRGGADAIEWVDVANCSPAALPDGCTRDRLLGRFHVMTADGALIDGGRAFIEIWRALPVFRPLAMLFSLPGATPVLERLYTGFLKMRPRLQRWVSP